MPFPKDQDLLPAFENFDSWVSTLSEGRKKLIETRFAFTPPEALEEDRKNWLNVALISQRTGRDMDEVTRNLETLYIPAVSTHKDGLALQYAAKDSNDFYEKAKSKLIDERDERDTFDQGVRAALLGEEVIPSLQSWQKENGLERMPKSTAFTKGFLKAREAGRFIGLADELLSSLEVRGGMTKDGQTPKLRGNRAKELLAGYDTSSMPDAWMSKDKRDEALSGIAANDLFEDILGDLSEMTPQNRQLVYKSLGARAEAKGYDQKGFWSQMSGYLDKMTDRAGSSIGATVGNAVDVLSNLPGMLANNVTVEEFAKTDASIAKRDSIGEIINSEIAPFVTGELDPVKATVGWLPDELEKGLIKAPGAVLPFMAVSAATGFWGGSAVFVADFAEQNRRDLRASGMDNGRARALGVVAAPLQALVESLSNLTQIGRFPGIQRVLAPFSKPVSMGGGLFGRYAQNVGTSFALEFTEEQLQENVIVPVLQNIAAAVDQDMPGVGFGEMWSKVKSSSPELFWTLLPMAFVFGGSMTAAQAGLSADFTQDRTKMMAANFSAAQANDIALEPNEKARIAKARSLWLKREGTPQTMEAAAQIVTERMRQLAGDAGAMQAELERRGIHPRILHNPTTGGWTMTFPDNSKAEFATAMEANASRVAFMEDQFTKMLKYEQETLLAATEGLKPGQELAVINVPEVSLVRKGDANSAEIQSRMEQGVALGEMTAEQVFGNAESMAKAAGDGEVVARILGSSINEYYTAAGEKKTVQRREALEDVLRITTRLYEGASILTQIEETLEGHAKDLASGKTSRAWMVERLRNYEQISGNKLFASDENPTDKQLAEAWSHIGQYYLVGQAATGGSMKGKRNLQDYLAQHVWRSGLGPAMEAEASIFGEVARRSRKIMELKAAGKLDSDLTAELERQLGIDSQVKFENDVAGDFDALANEVLNMGDASYSEENTGPNAETLSIRQLAEDFQQKGKFYRVIQGEDAFRDVVESGLVRTNAAAKVVPGATLLERLKERPTAFPSFSKDYAAMSYAQSNPDHYIIVTDDASLQPSTSGRHSKGKTHFPTNEQGEHLSSLPADKVDVFRHIGDGMYELAYSRGNLISEEASYSLRATNTIAKDKGVPSSITPEVAAEFKDRPIAVGMADLIGASGEVRGVDVYGGSGYPVQKFVKDKPNKITAVWASMRTGINSVLANLEKTGAIWQDKDGHHWALFSPHTMSQEAHRSNAQTPLVYLSKVNKMANRGAISRDHIVEISNHIRSMVPGAVDMPDFGTVEAETFFGSASFETRANIMAELTTARSRDLGAPSPDSILTESRDPQYHGAMKDSITSLILIDVDRMATKGEDGKWTLRKDLSAADFEVDPHPSYDTIMPGRILAHFDHPVPFEVALPEMLRTMKDASPKSRPSYLLVKMPKDAGIKFQPLTDEIIKKINEVQAIGSMFPDQKGATLPQIKMMVDAVNGNWKNFTQGESTKGLIEFTNAIDRSPAKESLTPYTPKEVSDMVKGGTMTVHQLGDQDVWFGIKMGEGGSRELVSVVNNTGIPGTLNVIMAKALELGANKLDAYAVPVPGMPEGLLATLYGRHGWKQDSRAKFERKYLLEQLEKETPKAFKERLAQKEAALKMYWEEQGWNGQALPDMVFMSHDGIRTERIRDEDRSSLAEAKAGSIRSASGEADVAIRGGGLKEVGAESDSGGVIESSDPNRRVLPRGADTILRSLASVTDTQLQAIGVTRAEFDTFAQESAEATTYSIGKANRKNSLRVLLTKKALTDAALNQASWKDWYSEHKETLDEFFGDSAELFQKILSVTSQASSVKANVGLALKAFGQLMRNENFDGKLRGEAKSGYLPAVISNLNAVKDNLVAKGRKISNYTAANEGDLSRVVVDRHISRLLFGVDTPSKSQYDKAEKLLTKIGNEIGWSPSQVQAALWAHSIVQSGETPESYGAYLKKLESKPLTRKELKNGLIGNQLTRRIGNITRGGDGLPSFGTGRGRYSSTSPTFSISRSELTGADFTYSIRSNLAQDAEYSEVMSRYQGTQNLVRSPKGRVHSSIVRDLLQRRKDGENISPEVLDRAVKGFFPSSQVAVPKSMADLPSEQTVRNAISGKGQPGIKLRNHLASMEAGEPAPGTPITVRQDVPSMTDHGVGVVTTVTENGTFYRAATRAVNAVFDTEEALTLRIGLGSAKGPHIKVEAEWSEDQSMPPDLENWTQVGFNPDRHSFYYERGTERQVVAADEIYQVGNTVFARNPVFKNVRTGISYSIRPGDFESRMTAAFSPFKSSPELRQTMGKVGLERVHRVGAEWVTKGARLRSVANIDAERKSRYTLKLAELLGTSGMTLDDVERSKDQKDYETWQRFQESKDLLMKSGMTEEEAVPLADASSRKWRSNIVKNVKESMAQAKAEADKWAEGEKKKSASPKAQREMLKAGLRTLDALLSAFPPEVRAKVGGYVKLAGLATDEAMLDEIERRIAKLDEEATKWLRKEGLEAIEGLFKKAAADYTVGKKAKGKIGADEHHIIQRAEAATRMTGVQVMGALADLDARIASGELTAEQEAMLRVERGIVELAGNLYPRSMDSGSVDKNGRPVMVRGYQGADVGRLYSAIDSIRDLMAYGAWAQKQAEIAKRERWKAIREALIEDTGKEGNDVERREAAERMVTYVGKSKAALMELSSFSELMTHAFGADSAYARMFVDGERDASNDYEDEIQEFSDELNELFTQLAGGKVLAGEQLRYDMSQPSITAGTSKLSQLEAIQALLMWRQEDGRRHMEGNFDENGKLTSAWGYDQAWVDTVTNGLTDEALEVFDWIARKYSVEHDELNPIYRRRNGINMPKHDNYAPVTVAPIQAKLSEGVNPLTDTPMNGGIISPGSLRTRSTTAVAEPKFRDAIATIIAHKKMMGYWKHYYDVAVEANAILGNREVANAVEAKIGAEGVLVLNRRLSALAMGGVRDASAGLALTEGIRSMTNRAATIGLLGRFSTLLIQSTQLAASSVKMPVGAYLYRFGKLMTGNLSWGDSIRSEFIQRRIKSAPPIVRQSMQNLASAKRPNEITRGIRLLGVTLSGADGFFTAGTYAILLDYHRTTGAKLGLSGEELEAHATAEATRETEQVAQPTRDANRSFRELSATDPLAKIGWAYASESRQKLALFAWAALDAKSRPGYAAKVAFLTFGVGGLLTQIIKNAWRELGGDDDEEKWSPTRLTTSMLTSPLHGVPVVGSLLGDGDMLSGFSRAGASLERITSLDYDDPVEVMRDVDVVLSAAGLLNDNVAGLAAASHIGLDLSKMLKNAFDD